MSSKDLFKIGRFSDIKANQFENYTHIKVSATPLFLPLECLGGLKEFLSQVLALWAAGGGAHYVSCQKRL